MRRSWTMVVLLAGFACIAAGGSAPLAKLAYLAGAYETTLRLSDDQAVRGAVLYRLGRFEEADAAFAAVGRTATYDRAASLAATGRYDLSIAYYDAVLFSDRNDDDARFNRSIISDYVHHDPVAGEADEHGGIAAILAGAESDEPVLDSNDIAAVLKKLYKTPRKQETVRSVAASQEWLATLADAPGEFLRKRLEAEYERREAEGKLHREEPSPW